MRHGSRMRRKKPLPTPLVLRPFTRAEALELGATDRRLRGNDLSRPFHGVRATSPPADLVALCRAFAPRMSTGSFFSSITAARLLSLPVPSRLENERRIHVAVPSPTRGIKAQGVIGHKVQLMGDDSTRLLGLNVATACRTFCELAAVFSLPELVAVGDHIIHWRYPLASRQDLVSAANRYPGQRGRGRLPIALGLLNDRAESPMESVTRVLFVAAGLDGFLCNHQVWIDGRQVRIDIAFLEFNVAVEYQGDYHRDSDQWRRDMTRRSILASAGWLILEINADDVRNPAELVRLVLRAIATQRGVLIGRN